MGGGEEPCGNYVVWLWLWLWMLMWQQRHPRGGPQESRPCGRWFRRTEESLHASKDNAMNDELRIVAIAVSRLAPRGIKMSYNLLP